MKSVRIGGVPEHFNMPWHLALEEGAFKNSGIELIWEDFPGGTGAMTQALREGRMDMCLVLTEGMVADMVKHPDTTRIIGSYVSSPLHWGVHTSPNNPVTDYQEAFDKRFAISRKGSGSHLMPIIDAKKRGIHISDNQWHTIANFNNALKKLKNREVDVFYWEKYTTSPWVDRGELRLLGVFTAPWPAFVLAAHVDFLKRNPRLPGQLLDLALDRALQFKVNSDSPELVSQNHQLKRSAARQWLAETSWESIDLRKDNIVETVSEHLAFAGIISADDGLSADNALWS